MVQERFDKQFDKQVAEKYDQVVKKASFLVKLAVPQVFKDTKKHMMMDKIGSNLTGKLGMNLDIFKDRSIMATPNDKMFSIDQTTLSKNESQTTFMSGSIGGSKFGRKKTILLKDTTIKQKDVEFDWRDRLKTWKLRQQTDTSVVSFEDQLKKQNQSAAFSVLGCLQASFSCEKLAERVEESLVYGLRRSAGLHLLNFCMNLSFNRLIFFDIVQWLQGSLRNNLM